MTDENDDTLFDDVTETEATEETSTEEVEASTNEETPEAETEDTSEQSDDEEAAPSAAEETEEGKSAEKLIPEHRHKAALKNVTERLEAAEAELAQLKQQPAPDRTQDPDGYERHQRLEISKQIMSETHTDYNDKIMHFQAMSKDNPHLNVIVANHAMPAKLAYDLASRDMEIRDLRKLKDSDDWKQFQDWKKEQAKQKAAETQEGGKPSTTQQPNLKVPNLNRATNVQKRKVRETSDDDGLFADVKY